MTTIGSVTISVHRYSGWDYPQFGQVVSVLSDGTSVRNEVIQGGASPRRRAELSGALTSAGDIATLRGYNLSKEVVEFVHDSETLNAHVLDFSVARSRAHPWLYEYSISLIEGEPDESSS